MYRSIDKILHDLDRSIIDARVTMVGYGMIGENVCRAFSMCKEVRVFDSVLSQCLSAMNNKFEASVNYLDSIPHADIVISSTG